MTDEHRQFLKFIGFLVLIGCIVAGPLLLSPHNVPLSARVGAMGGLLALFGVVIIARPLWRVGPLKWAMLKVQDQALFDLDKRYFKDHPENEALRMRIEDKRERIEDEIHQQFLGPMLVGIGTVVNGFSGYFM